MPNNEHISTPRRDDEMKQIPLTKGLFALVDDGDFELISQYKWHVSAKGYAVRVEVSKKYESGRRLFFMHREILGLKHGDGIETDHRDTNRLNNQRSNLRVATRSQNIFNRGKHSTNTSGYKGVTFCKRINKWRVFISFNGRRKFLGDYTTPAEGHEVYCLWADMLHGDFANYG